MLSQNYALLSFTIYLFVKIVCEFVKSSVISMRSKPTLTSIPERSENEEDERWVSKKKHDVLKAKYKCLKKLFQIYDASVIGILPEPFQECQSPEHQNVIKRNTDNQNDDNITDDGKTAAPDVIKELKLDQVISVSSNEFKTLAKSTDDKSTQDSKENVSVIDDVQHGDVQHRDVQHPVPYLVINEKKKLTRFQSFIQRILGIRERYAFVMSNDREYASDNNISNRYEKRRRRGLRLRRTRRPKKTQSEMALRDIKSPAILSYVQSVQRHCLMDTTPRHCPITGCKMLLYGIINYNDHLNLSHFPQRAHVCVYCREGFASEGDKTTHEHEHIGITKLSAAPSTARASNKIASNTQTDPLVPKLDVPEEKLKKIVSFFDKITDTGQVVTEPNKTRYSDTKLRMIHRNPRTGVESSTGSEGSGSGSHPMSLKMTSTAESDVSSRNTASLARCQLCGDIFEFRHQLNLHLDTHHRKQEKFTKFNSCAGILNSSNQSGDRAGDRSNRAGDRSNRAGDRSNRADDRSNRAGDRSNRTDSRSNQGESCLQTATQSLTRSFASTDVSDVTNLTKLSRRKSNETLSYDPSTNIIYFGSTESVKESSLVQNSRSGLCYNYKWEPGTAIIRV